MSEHAPQLCNMGGPPRATMVWNGREAGAAGGGPANGGWCTLRVVFDRPNAPDAKGRGRLLGRPDVDPTHALLPLLGHAEAGDPERTLTALIETRIAELELPEVLPAGPAIDTTSWQKPVGHITDLLTVLALQAKTVGRLVLRDGETRLVRIRTCQSPPGQQVQRFEWAHRVFIDDALSARIKAYYQPGWNDAK